MRAIPPHRTGRPGRRLLLITLIALIAFPTFSLSKPNGGSDTNSRIRDLVKDAQLEVRDLEGNLKFQLRDGIPKTIPESQFSDTVFGIGEAIHEAHIEHKYIRMDFLSNVRSELSSFTPDFQSTNQLVGRGGCVDRALEALFWDEPADFTKGLVMTAQGTNFKVEYFFNGENGNSKAPTAGALMSAVANPRLKFKPVFTTFTYGMTEEEATATNVVMNGNGNGFRPRIDFVIGGSNTHPKTGQFNGCAGVFGLGAEPGSSVDVFSVGLGWNLMQTVTADSRGAFKANFEGLNPGIGLYGAHRSVPYTMTGGEASAQGTEYEVVSNGKGSMVEMALELGRIRDRDR
jgi:hypothetical protein